MLICYPVCYTQATLYFHRPFIQIYPIFMASNQRNYNQLKETYYKKLIWHDCYQTLFPRLLKLFYSFKMHFTCLISHKLIRIFLWSIQKMIAHYITYQEIGSMIHVKHFQLRVLFASRLVSGQLSPRGHKRLQHCRRPGEQCGPVTASYIIKLMFHSYNGSAAITCF